MKITRYAYERNTRRYDFNIDADYIEDINSSLNITMGDTPHPVITMNMVAAVVQHESDWDTFPELEFHVTPYYTLEDLIWDYVNDDIWGSDSEIIDGETDDWTDEVDLDADEEKEYTDYVLHHDCATTPEGNNDTE